MDEVDKAKFKLEEHISILFQNISKKQIDISAPLKKVQSSNQDQARANSVGAAYS
ncbi:MULTISPECIES: hypothetical protein [Nitrosomonas]|uniref:Uncharacterized protein n=1 Tax=Nitrosomonas communis TaxID=44574 RepID=A0A5D3YAZ8_9PROT|nr:MULTISPECIES: hypothetical protein [Nitrosomonas]TYP80019.1 hypothetical protein BCL69_10643 [Nitrosomonas communis]UVS61173.1 hypothetical protein NX761_17090 [Nitrosomonas sp. PLL12]